MYFRWVEECSLVFRDSHNIWTHECVRYCPLRVHVQVHYWKSRAYECEPRLYILSSMVWAIIQVVLFVDLWNIAWRSWRRLWIGFPYHHVRLGIVFFLPRDAMHRAAYAVMLCLCVCPSRSWIVSKQINISSKFSHIAKRFYFLRTKAYGDIPTGIPVTGASNTGVMKKFWFSTNISLYLANGTR